MIAKLVVIQDHFRPLYEYLLDHSDFLFTLDEYVTQEHPVLYDEQLFRACAQPIEGLLVERHFPGGMAQQATYQISAQVFQSLHMRV